MTRSVLSRVLTGAIILFLASVGAFVVPNLMGVDPARAVLAARIPEREPDAVIVERLRTELGLDAGPVVRYQRWLAALLSGDLGFSYVTKAPVGPQLVRAGSITGVLVAVALAGAVVVAIPAGAAAALNPGGRVDRIVSYGSALGTAVPEYVLGPILILFVAVHLGALPTSGWQGARHLILPAATLGLSAAGYITHLTRAEMTDALLHPSVVAAQAKGLSRTQAARRHALPNALTSVIGLVGLWAVGLLGGAVVVEVIFAIPGLGRLLLDAVIAGDIPVIQGAIVVLVAVALAVSLVVDLAQMALDPRSRTAG